MAIVMKRTLWADEAGGRAALFCPVFFVSSTERHTDWNEVNGATSALDELTTTNL